MVKVNKKIAERMVPLRLLSNLKLPVKKMVRRSIKATLKRRYRQAPKMPGMPPSPSGGGGESSTAPPAGAADAAAPETLPMFFKCCMFFSTVPGLWIMTHSSVASLPR